MQGVHVFERPAKTVIEPESFVEQGHLLRKIDRVLNTAFARESTAACYADGLGRPSVDATCLTTRPDSRTITGK